MAERCCICGTARRLNARGWCIPCQSAWNHAGEKLWSAPVLIAMKWAASRAYRAERARQRRLRLTGVKRRST